MDAPDKQDIARDITGLKDAIHRYDSKWEEAVMRAAALNSCIKSIIKESGS